MMNLLPSIIRKELLIRVPQSIANEITCFAFYDNHPWDTKSIDVIVCTQRGEIREFYKRDIGATYLLRKINNIREIKLLRNSRCDLFYMVVAEDKIVILSRNEHDMALVHEINNVASYTIEDAECKGQAYVKIIKKDDAVPLILDENFETLQEKQFVSNITNKSSDILPLMVQLKRKLSEAQYCVKYNESKYKELRDLKQQAIFHMYQKRVPDDFHSFTKVELKEVKKLLQIEAMSPEVKLCNKKILIILNVVNKNHMPLEDVAVLLHTSKHSITYRTKLYTEIEESPYWQEKDSQNIEPHSAASIVAVVDLKELQYLVNSRIQVEVVLSYSNEGKSLLLPFEKVLISASDIMGENYDVLSSNIDDRKKVILCILSSGEKKTLNLKHITDKPSEVVTPYEIFCTHLKLELLSYTDNVAIHNVSPYHILHGVMVVFTNVHNIDIDVYTRSPSQVLALIHYIYDAVPHRIVVLIPEIKMTSLEYTSEDNEEVKMQDINVETLGESLMNQTLMLKKYLDECLIKMNESKNPTVQNKVGTEIDITAQGLAKFMEFREKILDCTEQGISELKKKVSQNRNKSIDAMVVDE